MIRDTDQSPSPKSEINDTAPAIVSVLERSEELWAARDADALVASATTLLHELSPRTIFERRKRTADAGNMRSSLRDAIEITLPGGDTLVVVPGRDNERPMLQAAARLITTHIGALAEKAALKCSVEHLGRSERLQRALYDIAGQASAAGMDLAPTFRALHRIVSTLMYADNFYITLYDRERDRVRFAYYADTVDPEPPSADEEFSLEGMEHGPTWQVLQRGTPLRGSMEEIANQIGQPLHGIGPAPNDWLGVPLLHGTDVTGCVVVQSYNNAHDYTEADQSLLTFLAQHIQMALARRSARADLERRVAERTLALSEANAVMQREVIKRERGERLQATLFKIAELSSATDNLADLSIPVRLTACSGNC